MITQGKRNVLGVMVDAVDYESAITQIIEAARDRRPFALAEKITGKPMRTEYVEQNRIGDHIWWVGSNAAFQADYPEWKQVYDVPMICQEIYEANVDKWVPAP